MNESDLQDAFTTITQCRLPLIQEVMLRCDETIVHVPEVVDQLARSTDVAPPWLCKALGLQPPATYRECVRRYCETAPTPTAVISEHTKTAWHAKKKRAKKKSLPRIKLEVEV